MSISKDLRRFIADQITAAALDPAITQIAEGQNSELSNPDDGMIWFERQTTAHARTLGQAAGPPDEQTFDIEIYHPDPDVTESHADALQSLDGYRGPFGDGSVQAFFCETQGNDYLPRVRFSDDLALEGAFLVIEVRLYEPPAE
jgi:hypothetical protein